MATAAEQLAANMKALEQLRTARSGFAGGGKDWQRIQNQIAALVSQNKGLRTQTAAQKQQTTLPAQQQNPPAGQNSGNASGFQLPDLSQINSLLQMFGFPTDAKDETGQYGPAGYQLGVLGLLSNLMGQQMTTGSSNYQAELSTAAQRYQIQQAMQADMQNFMLGMEQARLSGQQLTNQDYADMRDLMESSRQIDAALRTNMRQQDLDRLMADYNGKIQQRLDALGVGSQLASVLAPTEANREVGLTDLYMNRENNLGNLYQQQQRDSLGALTGLAQTGSTLNAQERMNALNQYNDFAKNVRSMGIQEGLGYGQLENNLLTNLLGTNAQRESDLLGGAVQGGLQSQATEAQRQKGLTDSTVAGYQALAQLAQSPSSWVGQWQAIRGEEPTNAGQDVQTNLSGFLSALGNTALGINPSGKAGDSSNFLQNMLGDMFRRGQGVDVVDQKYLRGIDNANNASYNTTRGRDYIDNVLPNIEERTRYNSGQSPIGEIMNKGLPELWRGGSQYAGQSGYQGGLDALRNALGYNSFYRGNQQMNMPNGQAPYSMGDLGGYRDPQQLWRGSIDPAPQRQFTPMNYPSMPSLPQPDYWPTGGSQMPSNDQFLPQRQVSQYPGPGPQQTPVQQPWQRPDDTFAPNAAITGMYA